MNVHQAILTRDRLNKALIFQCKRCPKATTPAPLALRDNRSVHVTPAAQH